MSAHGFRRTSFRIQTKRHYNTSSDEIGLKKYLTYFTFDPNGVDYASSSTERDSRDKSQLFHRLDYGPVTVLFLDTNKGGSAPSGSRAPSFDKGSLQYQWIERNLRDARDNRHSRFIFVVSHQDPYSCGKHNKSSDEQSTANVRAQLTDLMLQYGVTGWLAGHDEMQEHAQVTGSGHTMHVYDLGSAGDGLKGVREYPDNAKYITYAAYFDSPDGTHYGHLQVEVAPSNGVWYCTMTPAYSYFASPTSPSEYRQYEDKIVIAEGGKIVYEQRAVPDEESVTLRLGETVTRSASCDSACYWVLGGSGANATFEHLEVSANGSPKATSAYTDYSLRTSSEISTLNVTLTGRSVGTETVVLGRDYTPDNPKAVRILHVTVLPLELTEATAPNQTYTGKVLSPSVTVKAGTRTLSASDYEIVNWSGDRINAGTYTATVRGMGDFGGEVPLSFTIDPKPVTVEANPLSKEYGTADPKLTATVKGLVDGESAEDLIKYDISREAGEDYGTYFITPSGDAVQGNYAVAYQTALFTITKAQAAPRGEVTASLEYGTRLGDAQVIGTMEDRRTHTEVKGVFTFGDEDRILSVSDSGVQCAATFTPDKEFEGNYDPT